MKKKILLIASLLTVVTLDAFKQVSLGDELTADATFGTNGYVQTTVVGTGVGVNVLPTTNSQAIADCRFRSVVQLSDGSYLAGGIMRTTATGGGWANGTQTRWALAKYTANGDLDTTFGAASATAGGFLGLGYTGAAGVILNGVTDVVTTTLADEAAASAYIATGIFDMQVLANDIVVAVGTARNSSNAAAAADRARAAIIKINAASQSAPNATFGTGGVVYFDGNLGGGSAAEARALDIDDAGNIYVAGCAELLNDATNTAAATRSGAMVFTANADGTTLQQYSVSIPGATGDLNDSRVACATAIKVLSSGLVAVAGYTYTDVETSTLWVARFDPADNTVSGTLVLDSTFGDNGIKYIPLSGIGMAVSSILEEANGSLAVVGSTRSNLETFAAINNYDSDNESSVISFQLSGNGKLVLALNNFTFLGSSTDYSYGYSAQLQDNGVITVIGSVLDTNQVMSIANMNRLLQLSTSSVLEFPNTATAANGIAAFGSTVDADGNMVLVGSRYDGSAAEAGIALARVTPRPIGTIGDLSTLLLQRFLF
jgi:hypothetical protein